MEEWEAKHLSFCDPLFDGKTWIAATLGEDFGWYAFRPWSYVLNAHRGKNTVMARATDAIGQTQTASLILNPAGYHHNIMQRIDA